jgi:hypothetical protein
MTAPGQAADREGEGGVPQVGLFVIWGHARAAEDRIVTDLADRFEVLHVYDVHWSRSLLMRNFRRFYSDIDVRGIAHLYKKGAGAFLAITAVDHQPRFEERMTARGMRLVNSRFLDAKVIYREWTSDLVVHCGENEWENTRDITMLLGEDPRSHLARSSRRWDGLVERLDRDIVGARGWPSARELFRVLNETVRYAVLEPDDPVAALDAGASSVELLAGPRSGLPSTVPTILNADPRFLSLPDVGGRYGVSVGGRSVTVTIRHIGDQLLDARWEADLIARRELDPRGWYRLSTADAAEVRGYRALMHRTGPDRSHLGAVALEARAAGASPRVIAALADPGRLPAPIDEFLAERGYAHVRPLDLRIPYRYEALGVPRPALRRLVDRARLGARLAVRSVTCPLRFVYLEARDRILLAAPWAREVRRTVARAFH